MDGMDFDSYVLGITAVDQISYLINIASSVNLTELHWATAAAGVDKNTKRREKSRRARSR